MHNRSREKLGDLLRCVGAAIACAAVLLTGAARAETLQGKVIAVTDGDTIKVLDIGMKTHVVRMLGIDAPEKKQPFGQQSRQHLAGLVFGQTVKIEWRLKDRDDRLLAKVLANSPSCPSCGMTLDVNLAQVTTGHAWWYHHFAKNQTAQDRALYEQSEESARGIPIGLWSGENPIPPWEWRKGRRR